MTEYHKDNPFPAKIIERYILNQPGSSKKTYHITMDISESNFSYKVGDAVGIYPQNPYDQVRELLDILNKTGNEKIIDPRSGSQMTLEHFLKTKTNLLRITTPLLNLVGNTELLNKENKQQRAQFLAHHDLIDLFKMRTPTAPIQEIISYFSPLLPRFYSIASAPTTSLQSIDLLVATFQYKRGNKQQEGTGSHFLCSTAKMHTTPIPLYIHPSLSFTLPASDKPILMIGPGTGVAPYRAFLQERENTHSKGKNWLIFGERHHLTDYYYKDYFESLSRKNFLKIDLAFSRDQKEKVYVHHKLLENAAAVWAHIQSGGTIFVCGDAQHMAKDVTTSLQTILEKEGNLSMQEAKNLLKAMRRKYQLLMDVY